MSSVSQTPPRPNRFPAVPGGGFARSFVFGLVIVGVILGIAIGPAGRGIVALGAHAHPHGPDMALLDSLPLAIKLHVGGALAALVLGAVLMSQRKGRTFHRTAGWAWVGLVSLVAGSSLFITTLRPGHFSILHLFTGWTLIVLPLAVVWARRHNVARHRRTMMGLFYGGFAVNFVIAFIPGRTLWTAFFG